MDRTLSIVIPIRNAQQQLVEQTPRLLDAAADLTSQFEVLLVDDASTDQSDEVAVDLARRYPQVRIARHRESQGKKAAIETGLNRATGEIVLVHDLDSPLSAKELSRLWSLRNDEKLVMAQAERKPADREKSTSVVYRMMTMNDVNERSTPSLQMIRREAAEALASKEEILPRRTSQSSRVDPQDRDVSGRRPPNFLSRVNRVQSRNIAAPSDRR